MEEDTITAHLFENLMEEAKLLGGTENLLLHPDMVEVILDET